jgi:ACS family glucarate transporter-like MFS transporter
VTQKPTFVRWRVFFIMAMGSFVAYVLRSDLSIAGPVMMKDLGLTEIEWGWVFAAFSTSYAIFQFPGGIFGDKVGPRKALAIIASLWSICMLLTLLVPSPAVASGATILGVLMAVRVLVGIVQAPIFPVINATISHWFPVGGWALPLGLSSTGLTLGSAASAPLFAWLLVEFGWRTTFVIVAPLGFLITVFWWWYARDKPADHPAINQAEIDLITAKRPAPILTPMTPPGWMRVLKDRNIILLTASYFFSNYVFWLVFYWFFIFFNTERGLEYDSAAYVMSVIWICAAAGATLGGWLCDHLVGKLGLRLGNRWPIVIGQTGCVVFLVIGAYSGDPIIAAAFLGLCFFFQQITEGAYWSSSIAIGNQFAGAAGGVLNTGANVMGILNSLFVPIIALTFSWSVAIASGAIFTSLALVLVMFARADQPIDLD